MKLVLDHHYPKVIAPALRERGHDVVTVLERGWHQTDDDVLLSLTSGERRALMTNNIAHFAVIATDWMAEAKTHYGLIFTSDRRHPRREENAGSFILALDALLLSRPEYDALVGLIVWL